MMKLVPTLCLVLAAAALVPAAGWGAETPTREQWELAGGPAVKIVVQRDGLYRVSRQRLLQAGLRRTAPSRSLRLFTDGREVPIRVRRDRSIEFFGAARSLPTTDARTYWLVTRSGAGKRFRKPAAGRKGKPLRAFDTTVENRLRTVYFAFLKDGPTDNFFGPFVRPGEPATQTMSVPAPAPGTAFRRSPLASTAISLGPHEVTVTLNGQRQGSGTFTDRKAHEVTARVPVGLVRPGDNSVSVSVGAGELDFVLLWRVRLAYSRQLEAIGDRLHALRPPPADGSDRPGSRRRTCACSTSRASTTRGRYGPPSGEAVTATPRSSALRRSPGGSSRSASRQSSSPAAVVAERPSNLHRSRTRAPTSSSSPTATSSRASGRSCSSAQSQGLSVKVVDVEDVYDEFHYGIHGVDALRRFFLRAYQSWRTRPRYVLIFGDGSYDPQNYLRARPARLHPVEDRGYGSHPRALRRLDGGFRRQRHPGARARPAARRQRAPALSRSSRRSCRTTHRRSARRGRRCSCPIRIRESRLEGCGGPAAAEHPGVDADR